MQFLQIITTSLLFIFVFIIYKLFIKGILTYLRVSNALGSQHVYLLYHPLKNIIKGLQQNTIKYGDSWVQHQKIVSKNPNVKAIVQVNLLFVTIFLLDQQLIKQFSNKNNQNTLKVFPHLFSNLIWLNGLLHSKFNDWKRSRKLLSNLFHFEVLRDRRKIIEEIVDKNISNLKDRKELDIFREMDIITGRVVLQSLFGKQYMKLRFNDKNNAAEQVEQFIRLQVKYTSSIYFMLRRGILNVFEQSSKYLTQEQKAFQRRIVQFDAKTKQYLQSSYIKFKNNEDLPPFIKIYFQNQHLFQNIYYQMIQQLKSFLFAGQDTTAIALTNILYFLAQYPQYQKTFYQIFTNSPNFDYNDCKQLNNFIRQTLRIHPPLVNNLVRVVINNFKIKQFQLQKGDYIVSGIGCLMRNSLHFDDPMKFNPDRFNKSAQSSFSFIPFSAGPRNCIGQHMALIQIRYIIFSIIKKYRIIRTKVQLTKASTLSLSRAKNPYLVTFQER